MESTSWVWRCESENRSKTERRRRHYFAINRARVNSADIRVNDDTQIYLGNGVVDEFTIRKYAVRFVREKSDKNVLRAVSIIDHTFSKIIQIY